MLPLAALIFSVFAPTLAFGLVDWDDNSYVRSNPLLYDPRPMREYWLTPEIGYPIPLVIATYRVEVALGALATPAIFHATNVLLHMINVVLSMVLARRWGASAAAALFGACLFAFHPAVAEPVAWVTGRKDLLATAFGLGALLVATRARPIDRWPVVPLAMLALASKPTAVSVVFLLLGLNARQLLASRASMRLRVGAGILAATAAAAVAVAYRAHSDFGGVEGFGPVAEHLRRVERSIAFALRLVVGLEEPTMKYVVEPFQSWFAWGYEGLLVATVALGSACDRVLPAAHRRTFRFGIALAVVSFAPYANVIPLHRYLADSYLYAALIGIGIAAGAVVDAVTAKLEARTPLVIAATVALVTAFAPVVGRSILRFESDVALYGHAHKRYPASLMLCRLWCTSDPHPAVVLRSSDECIARFGPRTFEKYRSVALFDLGRTDEAIVWARRALLLDPEGHDMPTDLLDLAGQR